VIVYGVGIAVIWPAITGNVDHDGVHACGRAALGQEPQGIERSLGEPPRVVEHDKDAIWFDNLSSSGVEFTERAIPPAQCLAYARNCLGE
jgi:hypothetical protein